MLKIWDCKIGEVEGVPGASDMPMRRAVEKAYREITGEAPDFIFSGWGGELTECERAVVENREPVSAPPICIGRPIIETLANDGIWTSAEGASVVAASELFQRNPYAEIDGLKAALLKHGHHTDDCRWRGGHDCDCGWDEVRSR